MPRSKITGNMVVLFLAFWGTSMLFSIVAATSYTPTNSVWGFHILYTLFFSSTLLFVDFFDVIWQVWDDNTLWFWFVFL